MVKTFNELWEDCEKFHQSSLTKSGTDSNLQELLMKVSLYQALSSKGEMQGSDMKKVKNRVMGEILFALTKISDNDDVNTFTALKEVLELNSVNRLLA